MIGLVIIAHEPLASALVQCATHVFGSVPVRCAALDIPATSDVAGYVARLKIILDEVDDGHGVLIMSDLFGATPTNIAAQAVRSGAVEVLTGVNLPMVLRALSYRPNASLEVVLEKASAGGTAGVMKIASTAPQNQRVPGVAGSQGTTTDGETGLEYAHATMHHQQ